ncbi:zinc finger protein 883-like isoform X2 [Contarinia nasturtii]|uniref:zinc finger protein 883-like isoform X2 n=1 Tax=Contarinia nasturtii TaxID=265458 RepID=UPI0012D45358|nr:zinc finger protein 883-like isoform X2 [Contarinia nasturtii]
MSITNSCRLCLSINNGNHLDLFSVNGMEMKMCDIIAEHFKCEVNVLDSLPNFVCQSCWQITETFHELYQRSKKAQENLFNRPIKLEPDIHEPCSGHKDDDYMEEQLAFWPVKVEANSEHNANDLTTNPNDESDSNGNDPIFDENTNDENSSEKISSEDSEVEASGFEDIKHQTKKKPTDTTDKPKRKRARKKEVQAKFEKLFAEHKQLLDMSCDLCPTIFETLFEAQEHYAKEHKNSRGYIKCCGQRLIYQCHVVKHLERHVEPEKYKCSQCGKVILSETQFAKHMRNHTMPNEKTISCSICKKLFTSEVGLKHHMKGHTERNEAEDSQMVKFIAENFDMKCDHCETVFNGFYDARRHYKELHNDDKGYIKCCNIKLRELCRVREHVLSHLDPDCLKCDTCGKTFQTGVRLTRHKRRHRMSIEKRYICHFCGKSCIDKHAITRHLFSNHVTSEPEYECDVCPKKYHLASMLKYHKYSVHRERKPNFCCEICGKDFYVKFHLDKHMLHKHTDKSERLIERKQCEYCGDWLLSKSNVFYHHQKHTTGIQKCNHCQMEFPNRIVLLGHIRQHHREHKFKCSYCGKSFANASKMKTHEESHTRHKIYQCKFCPKTFQIQSSRQTHTRRNHPEAIKQKVLK